MLAHGAGPDLITNPGVGTGALMRDARTYGETALHRAAAFGDEHCIRMLIVAGADRACQDINGDTPLSWASWHQRPGRILALLAYGKHAIHPFMSSILRAITELVVVVWEKTC